MDVDNDIDNAFIQKFSSMGTTDKDVLIQEFQKVLGNQLNRDGCAFFLDMNNWNLQEAICSYLDFGAPKDKVPHMTVLSDETLADGQSLPANTSFVKTWRIKNSGEDVWPDGVMIRFSHGASVSDVDRVSVRSCRPGETVDVSVHMKTPDRPGMHEAQWRMCTAQGVTFGEVMWVVINVDGSGVECMAEQLEGFHLQHQQALGVSASHLHEQDSINDVRCRCSMEAVVGASAMPGACHTVAAEVPEACRTVAAPMSIPCGSTHPPATLAPPTPYHSHSIVPHNSPVTGTPLLSHHNTPLQHHSTPLQHHNTPLQHHSTSLQHHNTPLQHHDTSLSSSPPPSSTGCEDMNL